MPADVGLGTADGAVFVVATPDTRIAYKDLLGDGYFETALQWNGQMGNDLLARGTAQPKAPSEYQVVGQSVPRTDIRDNVFGRQELRHRYPAARHAARADDPPARGGRRAAGDRRSLGEPHRRRAGNP